MDDVLGRKVVNDNIDISASNVKIAIFQVDAAEC
jgi:hypothetical protein